ncbi:MAG: response regulator [Chloroflexia bacterium]|nr:response regulator [Chloroflexia bacterium]
MKNEIDILILEDNPEDFKIIEYQLKKLKCNYKWSLATNRAEFIDLLSKFPDIIISDFNLPDIDGFQVLELVKERNLTIPVIIASGTIGEEKAVDLILKGANDCVLKDRLLRLIPAIDRELKENEIRKEKKVTENALIIAKEKAEESDRLKSRFLANISHEIRTPLNGIMGFIGLLTPDLSFEKQQDYIGIIEKSGNQLLKIITDILEISKIETQKIVLDNKSFSVKQFLNELYQLYFTLFQIKKPEIKFNITPKNVSEDLFVITDQSKLKQIISNLIDNAFKFTTTGEIELIFKTNNNRIEFCIRDTGIGIHENSLDVIFEHFRQANNGISQLYGGTGLGLSISKNLVELMGGKINVKSKLGFGSEFSFFVPVEFQNKPDISALPDDFKEEFKCAGTEILIAEDDTINFMLLQEYFTDTNCILHHAKDGTEVYDLLVQHKNTKIILMDIKMPVMNGIDALKQIRQNNITIPVIAQTAYTFDYDKEQLKQLGFNDYISKPINKELLYKKMNKLLGETVLTIN